MLAHMAADNINQWLHWAALTAPINLFLNTHNTLKKSPVTLYNQSTPFVTSGDPDPTNQSLFIYFTCYIYIYNTYMLTDFQSYFRLLRTWVLMITIQILKQMRYFFSFSFDF